MAEQQNRPAKTFGPCLDRFGVCGGCRVGEPGRKPGQTLCDLRRTYNAGGNWKETQTLFDADLLSLARLLERAWEWIVTQQPRREQPS